MRTHTWSPAARKDYRGGKQVEGEVGKMKKGGLVGGENEASFCAAPISALKGPPCSLLVEHEKKTSVIIFLCPHVHMFPSSSSLQ